MHPNVVQIFEVGERERQLFYNAVEYVDGPTLADKVRNKPLTPRQAAQVIETLARAVHAAHEKGLIHRTLKPASILVAGKTDTPIDQCTLKVTDFGQVGRPTEGDINDLDLQGPLPHYLSPEQAWGRVKDFGPPTDVWALGAILYELLTGRPPFVADDWSTLIDKIQAKEVAPPSQIRRRLPLDLDAICRKCLAKNPRRRYASALALADDLRRYLDGYPVRSRPVSHAERLTKWIKRRPLTVALVLLMLVATAATLTAYLVGTSGSDAKIVESAKLREQLAVQNANSARNQLKEAEERGQKAEYFQHILLAEKAWAAGDARQAKALLAACPNGARHWEWYYLRDVADRSSPVTTLQTGKKPILSMASSSDGRLAVGTDGDANGDKKGEVRVWDMPGNRQIHVQPFDGPVDAVALGTRGETVPLAAAVSKAAGSGGSQVVVGSVRPGVARFTIDVPDARVTDLAYSPDQLNLAVSRNDGKTLLYPTTNGASGVTLPFTLISGNLADPNRLRLAFDKDGRLAVYNPSAAAVRVWDQTRGKVETPANFAFASPMCLGFSSDDRLAIGLGDGNVSLLNSSLATSQSMLCHPGAVSAVAFTPDAKRLATAGYDKTVKVWDVETGLEILTLKDLPAAPVGVAFSANGHRLAVAAGTEVRVYGSGRP
jgi:WD40 repeat protein